MASIFNFSLRPQLLPKNKKKICSCIRELRTKRSAVQNKQNKFGVVEIYIPANKTVCKKTD